MISVIQQFAPLIGGEIEVRNLKKDTLHVGRISGIQIGGERLRIILAWFARGTPTVGTFEKPISWNRVIRREYTINLNPLDAKPIGNCGVELRPFGTSLVIRMVFPPYIGLDPEITPIHDLRFEKS